MKIGVWLTNEIQKEIGGGYSYYSSLIKHIDNYKFNQDIEILFITNSSTKLQVKKTIIYLPEIKISLSFKQRLYKLLSFFAFFRIRHRSFINTTTSKEKELVWNKILKDRQIKLIFYPVQTQKVLENFPFIATNWDIGHKSTYAFPELSEGNVFNFRNLWYANELQKALFIFAESESGKQELIKYSGIFTDKIKILPLFPNNFKDIKISENEKDTFLINNELKQNKYLFYPAQFWAHKNHYNLILAFNKILEKHNDFKLVFTGSDQGNLNYIKSFVEKLNIKKNILFLGFTSMQNIKILYQNAIALVMPTFLGPTNMPLLEARELNCPILCSNLKGHKELLKDGAIYFKPDDYNDIADKIQLILDKGIREELLKKASDLRKTSNNNIESTIKLLDQYLSEAVSIRNCWA